MTTGLVDVGGGMRGIYAAGILDTCLEQGIAFDCCIGVSAGSANVISYLAGQKGRNYRFYHDYSFRRTYMSMENLMHTGSYIDLEYIYGTLSAKDGEDPLDYPAFAANPAKFFVVAEEAASGRCRYFDRSDIQQDNYRTLMASSCLPAVNRPIEIDGVAYYDGALADPVPIQKAFDEGCDRVVLILTKPVNLLRVPGNDRKIARIIQKKYPASAENLLKRADRYNDSVQLAREYQRQGKVLILAPDDISGVDTLKRDKEALHRFYLKGVRDGEQIAPWLTRH